MESITLKKCSSKKDFKQKRDVQARASKRRKRNKVAKLSRRINRK